jgi:hypothetical protein
MNRSRVRLAIAMVVGLLALAPLLAVRREAGPRVARSAAGPSRNAPIPLATGLEDDADAQAEMEFMMLRDPLTNTIPRGIHRREIQFARTLPDRRAALLRGRPDRAAAAQALVWTERGPNNVGGRTRAFAIDVTNPSVLVAGAVGGGIWRSTDDGASWSLRTAPGQIHSATCVAQDVRSGKTGTWYVGSGEIRGSTTNATRWGSLYLGDGIFKSSDGGVSWTLLPSTSTATPQTVDPFDYVVDVATNPANLVQDEVLAATYKGIYRSLDGGGSWTSVIASDSGFTDIAISPTGVMYASTRTGSAIKVWRSTNGTTWTLIQPATFPTTANRVVIAFAPSSPSVVYFFVQGANNSPQVAGHQLWRYTYLSGDGSGAGGTWVNRGGNLPFDLNTQTGYDQTIAVKPDDDAFVVIGGTNLYRSTDGFATTGNTTVIGGYPFYPDGHHHPDLHAGVFSRVDPKVYYSAGDGGIARASDITLADMLWTSLNHGYNVTQFYSVSIGTDAGGNRILAGAQDNGSQLGNAPGASDWVSAFGGDGTIVRISPSADDRLYTQYQGGQMQRQSWDGSQLTDITPAGAANQLFVNPIVLDPNVSTRLYYAAGTSGSTSMIWRSDNAPLARTDTLWISLPATNVGAGIGYDRQITALGISKESSPNVLYYGTSDGMVMRAANIHTGAPTVTNVTPPGLNGGTALGGFVRCVAVDPIDSNRALVAFGNYNFQSLWYTTNGGTTWTDVEGNLAGASGPSVRWATMFYAGGELPQLQVFLGTSIGVLSSQALAGGSTVWAQEAGTEIGNVIVGYMDYRSSDGILAVGTHGRGVFTTQIPGVSAVGDEPLAALRPRLGPGYPNPARDRATLTFDLPRAGDVSLRLYDVAGRQVAAPVNGRLERGHHEVPFATGRLAAGVYSLVLEADGVRETQQLVVRR